MSEDTGTDQGTRPDVTEVAQEAHSTAPTKTSTAPVRVRQKRAPSPKPAPIFIEPLGIDWDADLERIGAALAAELEGGAK